MESFQGSQRGWQRLPGPEAAVHDRSWSPVRLRHARVARSLDLEGKRVLDVGCANGLYSLYMADSAAEVVGIDHSRELIETAEKRAGLLGFKHARFICADLREPGLLGGLGRFDLVCCWGLIHRVTDPITLLWRLASVTGAFSLEWAAPVFVGSRGLSVAYHPEDGGELDPTNLGEPGEGETEAREKKIQGHTGFWCPTPRCIRGLLGRWGFRHCRVLGYGDGFRSYTRVLAGHALRRVVGGPAVTRRHLHMLVEREPEALTFRVPLRDATLPEWDVAARTYLERQARN